MQGDFRFRLPRIPLRAVLALRLDPSSGSHRRTILFSFEGGSAAYEEDPNLTWSTSLNSLYRYATPERSEDVLRLPALSLHPSTEFLRITLHQWQGHAEPGVMDAALEVTVGEETLVILPEAPEEAA